MRHIRGRRTLPRVAITAAAASAAALLHRPLDLWVRSPCPAQLARSFCRNIAALVRLLAMTRLPRVPS